MKSGVTHFSPTAKPGISLNSKALCSPKTHAALSVLLVFLNAGDIQELYDTTLALGHAAAFSDDCDLPSLQDRHRLVGLQVSTLSQKSCLHPSRAPPPPTQNECKLPSGLLEAGPRGLCFPWSAQLHSVVTPGQVPEPCRSHFSYLKHGNNNIHVIVSVSCDEIACPAFSECTRNDSYLGPS